MNTVHTASSTAIIDEFRRELFENAYATYKRTLLSVTDMVTGPVTHCGCPAHLSLQAQVGYAAFYRAMRQGTINPLTLLAAVTKVAGELNLPRLYAIDTTVIPRPYSPTSPDRALHHGHAHSRFSHQTMTGWSYQAIVRLTLDPDSWVLPVSSERVGTEDDKVEMLLRQIDAITQVDGATMKDPSLFLLDSGYPAARITHQLRVRGIPAEVLIRLSCAQVFHARPKPASWDPYGGRPRKHGLSLSLKTFQLVQSTSISLPYGSYGQVSVWAWPFMHQKISGSTRGFEEVKPLPVVEGTVLAVTAQHLRPSRRRGTMLLWYSGERTDLFSLALTYLRRFDIEHYFRYLKHEARIGDYHPQSPKAYTNWLMIHSAAYVQLLIARTLVKDQVLPWEDPVEGNIPPGRVKRVVLSFLVKAWQPARDDETYHKGPGRVGGKPLKKRKRHQVIRKHAKTRAKTS